MADPNNVSQYKYSAMSNLVLQHDRRFTTSRKDEATGDPESLAGRINVHDMGARASRVKADDSKKGGLAAANVTRGDPLEGAAMADKSKKRKREPAQASTAAETFVEGLRYQPKRPETRAIYEHILNITKRSLGDVSNEMVRSAADAGLEYLKDENMKDFDKKKEIEDLLGITLTSAGFSELINLSRKLVDYDAPDEEMPDAEDGGEEMELDERQGVAVVFDESSDEDEDGIKRTNEVRDEDEDSEEGDPQEEVGEPLQQLTGSDDDPSAIVIGSASISGAKDHKNARALSAKDIDAYWLQRKIGSFYSDAHDQQTRTQKALQILENEDSGMREVENDLMELFDYEHHDIVELLVANRSKIVFVTYWRRLPEGSQEQQELEQRMFNAGHRGTVDELHGREDSRISKTMNMALTDINLPATEDPKAKDDGVTVGSLLPKKLIDLESLVFEAGNHLMSNANVKLPQGSTKRSFKGYEEIHVPPPKARNDDKALMPASELPEWSRPGFGSAPKLNKIQTTCYNAAFNSDENLLICAPTGSGKTNVAMLAMLREIGKHRNPETGEIMLDDFKIIYIAPLKALVQEQVGNFGKRLESYGIRVSELTGDRQLTKQQIADTQIIVTTPEKWDVITRKATDLSYTNLVRLICIDEIHLLHDPRGPVLESIVSRTIRKTEKTGENVRLCGLSATLPNYRDVASFLRVDPEKGLFHFDSTYRPCPLKQEFVGVTDRKPIKQLKTMNEVCYTKVIEQVGTNKQQLLIFVHSRKETAKTAKYIRDKAVELETIGQILRSDAGSREILNEEAQSVQDRDLKDLLPYGFAIHHAGMSRADRTSVEELFAERMVQVLVCTATLAWGVNLPAHAVVIKGTQIYSPEAGSWVELSPQDILQMLGRAGRPQYDTFGEGIIITTQSEMQFYLSLLNQQLPIESQFVSKLADNLNAEVVLGNIRSRDEGVEWLGYTYLFVRMLRSPGLYSVGIDYADDDALKQKRVDLVHSAATVLEKCGLIKYDKKTGKLQSTELGRIASHYYISHSSMMTYNHHIQPTTSIFELIRVFALSDEFKYIPVRQDEKVELLKLLGRVPEPVKESVEEPQAKINVLLQAYISRLSLEGLALMADLVYVTQSASRILRAIFEIALKKGWASVAKTALDMCKMSERRMWPTMSPLRQFPTCPRNILSKAEKIDVPWSSYFDLDAPRMGELLGMPREGKTVCKLVGQFPRLDVQAQVQPITRSMLRVELTIAPNFEWENDVHGRAEYWWILVEDCDGEEILFHDQFMLRGDYATSEMNEHLVEFTVPMIDPKPPHYFVSLISDRWMHSETKIVLSFQKLILPAKFPPHTPLLDLQPPALSALKKPEYQQLYADFTKFNGIQTQTFNSLFSTDDNVFVGASTGSGKTVCAEFALLRHWGSGVGGLAVYVTPFQELVDQRHADWSQRFDHIVGESNVRKLTGETTADVKILNQDGLRLVLATPAQWDALSRQWRRRKPIQMARLFIADELHLLGGHGGYTYEIIISRMRYISIQLESQLRIIGLSVPLSNAKDLGEWIGASRHTIYNFAPSIRSTPIDVHLQSFTIPHFPSLMLAMAKPTYSNIIQMSPDKPAIVFVPSRKQVRSSAADLLSACIADDEEDRFLHADLSEIQPLLERVQELALAESLSHGIGYYHEALSTFDKRIVSHLYNIGAIQVMVASRDVCWEISITAHLVIVMNTQFFEGREHRYIDYPVSEILQMFGFANRPEDKSSRGVLMVPAIKRDYYKRFLNEALPIESHLQVYLHDAFVAEISTGTVSSTQEAVDWFTYTYFYRRLLANPSYYGLTDVSHQGLSAYLSELVENTLKDLTEAKLIEIEEEEKGDAITPLNATKIAEYYNISYITIQTFLLSLTGRTKFKQILEIVTSATEFESIQIRRHEDGLLKRIYDRLPVKLAEVAFESPHFKAFILLQAHFSRLDLPVDLAKDQEIILSKIIPLLSGCVDVLSSEGHLQSATSVMETCQLIIQAMWDRDSPLKQIPHFTPAVIATAQGVGINDVFDFMEAMSSKKSGSIIKALQFDKKQLEQAAEFSNKYPSVELEFEVLHPEEIMAGAPSYLKVKIQREIDEDEEEPDLTVEAPYFPIKKTENWWLVVGNANSLLGIKKVSFGRQLELKLEYEVQEPGKQDLKLYLISDSYVGVDQEQEFTVTAAEGMDEDEEDEEDEGE